MNGITDETAESLGRTWAKGRGVAAQRIDGIALPYRWRRQNLPDVIADIACRHWLATEPAAYIALGKAIHTCWLAADGPQRLAEAVAATAKRCAKIADYYHRQDEIDNGAAATGAAGLAAAAIRAGGTM